jgi:hypothetical protein
MTYFKDLGAVIDAPLDFVWRYRTSEDHGSAHTRNARNFGLKEMIGTTAVIEAERKIGDRWAPFVSKSTDFSPFCVCNEEIEGDFAGTRYVLLYHPDGQKTRIDVYGDVQSSVYPPEEAERVFLGLLKSAYEDDVAVIAKLRAAARSTA